MEANFPIAHSKMLRYEGGYSNHPADPGGVTLEGVIQRVYDDYRRSKGQPKQALRPEFRGQAWWKIERDDIYRSRYWHPPKCGILPGGVEAAIYDYSVNSGIGRSRKVLQRLVGVPDDGVIGPATLDAVSKRDPATLVNAICDERMAFLRRLRHWESFKGGWTDRVADCRRYCGALARKSTEIPATPASVPDTSARGEVPDKKTEKNVAKGAGPAAGAEEAIRDGNGWLEWIQANPIETALIVVAIVAAVALVIHGLNTWRKIQQEAPTPGIRVVPVKGG